MLPKVRFWRYNWIIAVRSLGGENMNSKKRVLPLARKDVLVKELQGEVMIFDSTRNKAFCLNQTSATVWNHCDGRTSILEMTEALRRVDSSISDSVVWFALQQLETDGLLERSLPAPAEVVGITRKELIKKLGLTAALVPLVGVVVTPTAVRAYSGGKPRTFSA